MDFWGTVQVLRRRWYVVVPALLIGAVITGLVYVSIPTRWQSNGVMVLTTPSSGARFSEQTTPEDAVRVNPLLAFDGSLTTTAQILAQILRDPATAETVGAGPDSGNEYLANNGDQNGPFVFVTVTSDDEAEAQALTGRVLAEAAKQLDDRQRTLDAPESTFIRSELLIKPTVPQGQIGGKIRFAGAAFVLSIILALVSAYAADSIAGRSRKRKSDDSDLLDLSVPGPEPTSPDIERTMTMVPHAPRPPADRPASTAVPPLAPLPQRIGPAPEVPVPTSTPHQQDDPPRRPARPRPSPGKRPAPIPRQLTAVEGDPVPATNGTAVNGAAANGSAATAEASR